MNKEKFQKYMIFIAFFGSLYLYVQAFRIFRTKQTAGISEIAFVIVLIASASWFTYSFIVNDPVIRISSTMGFIGATLVLILIFRYRGNEPPPKIEHDKHNRVPRDIFLSQEDRFMQYKSWYLGLRSCPKCMESKEENEPLD